MTTEKDTISDWPDRELATKVHNLLGKATFFGEPDFEWKDDPELYGAIKTLSSIFQSEKGNYEMGRTFGRILATRLCDYYGVGEEAKASTRITAQRIKTYGEPYESSLRVVGERININEFCDSLE